MIKFKQFLCAENIIRDAETNSISVINLIEEIASPGFPLLLNRISCFSLIEREQADPARFDFELIIKLDDAVIFKNPVTAEFQDKLRNRSIVTVIGVKLDNPGVLTFIASKDGVEQASYKIPANAISSPRLEIKQ